MTVGELIEQLRALDPELRVVVRGYEGGVNDVSELRHLKIELDANSAWYYGRHEEADRPWSAERATHPIVPAIELYGTNERPAAPPAVREETP